MDSFVRINYDTAKAILTGRKPAKEDIVLLRSKILDIIRNNPPLASVPKYYHDGREDYLWYSDFYDDVAKEVYLKYRAFIKPQNEITPANYTEELARIDLPYFKELVNLVGLERLCMDYIHTRKANTGNEKEPEPEPKSEIETTKVELPDKEQQVAVSAETKTVPRPAIKTKRISSKRSYEPALSDKQYAVLAECIEQIKLFRRPVKVSELKKLLKGKLAEPFQVANQKSLVYLFDQLSEQRFIKDTWVSVADKNEDFISFRTEGNKERYGDNTHYINMQQLLNCRNRNRRESIHGLENIENLIDELNKLNLE